jgi:hypothetical protein
VPNASFSPKALRPFPRSHDIGRSARKRNLWVENWVAGWSRYSVHSRSDLFGQECAINTDSGLSRMRTRLRPHRSARAEQAARLRLARACLVNLGWASPSVRSSLSIRQGQGTTGGTGRVDRKRTSGPTRSAVRLANRPFEPRRANLGASPDYRWAHPPDRTSASSRGVLRESNSQGP